MRFNVATVALATAPLAAAQNYMNKYPLSNGFPNPSASAIAEIEKNAGGYLPNGALPSTLSDDATAAFTLIALNEIFEVAYFSSLLTNITQNKPGYVPGNAAEQKYLMRSIFEIRAQEEIHALAANAVLKAAGKPTVTGCKYMFPATDLASGIHVANLFTDVVLGALAQVQGSLAMDGGAETALVPIIGAILAQEGEQVGYFRYFQDLTPSAAPLLTGTPAPFAYGALSMFLVPGSCNIYPNIPKLPSLTVVTTPQARTMDLIYTVEGTVDASQDTVTYLSGGGRNPVTVPIKNVSTSNGKTQFAASFPYDSGFANGLTLAAVTKGNGPFSSPSAVAAAAAYGPGLIEVD